MSTTEYSRPVRLSRRSRQGVVAGLDGWASGALALAGAIAVLAAIGEGFIGFFMSALLWLPIGLSAFIPLHGFSMPKVAVLWMSKKVRHAVGATQTRYRPERPQIAGTLNLPGVRANVQVWDVDGMAAAYNPIDKTVSITAELEVDGFLMLDTPERYDLSLQWGTVLASFTQRPGIKRVTLQERTVPTTIQAARQFYEETVRRRQLDTTREVAQNYEDVMDASEGFAVAHRNLLTLTLDLVALQAQLRELGGGTTAIKAVAQMQASNVTAALEAAHLNVRRWLSPREWAALGRTAFDPDFLSTVQNRTDPFEGVALSAIGPMALDEPERKNGRVRTDSGWHTTMWIHEWPRTATQVGFVVPLVFARQPLSKAAVSHIFTIVLTPVSVNSALKRIKTEKKIYRSNQKYKNKKGQDESAEDVADWEALQAQEESIVEGHGEYRYGGYLTISAATEEDLEASIAGATWAMSQVGMEGQILYYQQAEALMINALPLGQGMK